MPLNSSNHDVPALEDTIAHLKTLSARPKRSTAAKVDYAEKKEEDVFEAKKAPPQAQNTLSTPNVTGKRKNSKRNSILYNGSRSESPTPQQDDSGNDAFPMNYEPPADETGQFSNILDLNGAMIKDKVELKLKNGTSIKKNDNIYLICEPPGEPYYIGRIMAFVKKSSKLSVETISVEDQKLQNKPLTRTSKSQVEPADDYLFKINWWYRCRDISKKSTDSRLLYASMHSDTCPLQSFRGKCMVQHRDEIEDLEDYKSVPNQFWFDKLFDRYMIKFYDIVPTSLLTYLPTNYQKALQKRFQYIFIEQGRSKDMLQSPKSCLKCNQWCSSSDSVECCECHDFYHMLCLDPPMLKKPARGFAWSCIQCTRKIESSTMHVNQSSITTVESEITNPSNEPKKILPYEQAAIAFLERDKDFSFQQRRNEEEWIYRYLGLHAKLEDALDLQDRPYPRAASRLGNKHQLMGIPDWYGHIVEYYDNSELDEQYQRPTSTGSNKKKKSDNRKKKVLASQSSKETELVPLKLPIDFQSKNPNEFPSWLQERPRGYIERGGDSTVELMWKQPEHIPDLNDKIDEYVKRCAPIAKSLNLLPSTPNFWDAILKNLLDANYDLDRAFEQSQKITRKSLREPTFTPEETKKFEDGIRKFGSELWPTFKQIKSQPFSMIVRYYYLWKKTPNGHLIWDNYEGRKKYHAKKAVKDDHENDDIGNPADDSSYDDDKIKARIKLCKHCKSDHTSKWYKAPGQQHPDGSPNVLFALCGRCARLWRRYAVTWEDPNEVLKKTGQKGGNGWKKKVEAELAFDAEQIMKAKEKFSIDGSQFRATPPIVSEKRTSVIENGASNYKRKSTDISNGTTEKKPKKPSVSGASTVGKSKAKKDKVDLKKDTKESKEVDQETEDEAQDEKFKEEKITKEPQSTIISNVIQGNHSIGLHQATLERYYFSSSSIYNSKPKFKEHTSLKTPLVSQSMVKSFNYIENKNCGVCHQGPRSSCLHCMACGLNAHPECYGLLTNDLETHSLTHDYKWYCDPCSNTLNTVISTDYRCCICTKDYNRVRSPMKRTSGGYWVHLLCAFVTEGVTFTNLQSFQPVLVTRGVSKIMKYGLSKPAINVDCSFCDSKIDLEYLLTANSLTGNSAYRIAFKLTKEDKPDSSKHLKIFIGNDVVFGKVILSFCCSTHSKEEVEPHLFPLAQRACRARSNVESTLLTLWLEDHKKEPFGFNNIGGCKRRYQDVKDAINILNSVTLPKSENPDYEELKEKRCDFCSITFSMKWETVDDKTICYSCILKRKDQDADGDVEMCDEDNTLPIYKLVRKICDSDFDVSNYGIKNWDDHVIKPPESDEELYQIGPLEPSTEINSVDTSSNSSSAPAVITNANALPTLKKFNTYSTALPALKEQGATESSVSIAADKLSIVGGLNNIPPLSSIPLLTQTVIPHNETDLSSTSLAPIRPENINTLKESATLLPKLEAFLSKPKEDTNMTSITGYGSTPTASLANPSIAELKNKQHQQEQQPQKYEAEKQKMSIGNILG